MKLDLSRLLSKFPFYGALHAAVQEVKYRKWKKAGCPMPPPHKVKQQVLQDLASKYGLSTLVETGTLLGDMIHAMRRNFSAIYSIELYEPLYTQAVKRFRRQQHVTILNGDSGVVLHDLVAQLKSPVLFWLDGHYSGEGTALGDEATPIFKELDAIFSLSIPYAVAIDDARLFGSDAAYPTMEALGEFVSSKNQSLQLYVENDVIMLVPGETAEEL